MRLPTALTRPARYGALAGGAVPLLAFPAPDLSLVAWFGLVPGLLLIQRSPSAREAAVRGWWLGAGYYLAAMYWLAPEIGPGVLIVAVVFGVLLAPFGVAVWALLHPPVTAARALAALLVVPSYWLVTEWIRSWQAIGGPWAVFGASQWQHPAVLALAAVGGVWLISFVLVAVNVAILIAIVSRRIAPRLVAAAAAAGLVAAGPLAFALTPGVPAVRTATVALVQPGVVNNPVLRVDASQRLTAGLLGAGRPAGARPDLIAWGESSVAFHLQDDQSLLASIKALSRAAGAQILVNQDSHANGTQSKVAALVGPGGVDGTYTKTRLVPFGEYIPFRSALSWLTRISKASPVNMTPGNGAHVLRVAGGQPLTIGPLLCFESAFPDMSRADTGQGAQLIVYQTADSTFEGTWALAQHASLGALRAAETGRPVVQAALTGDSAAFDPRGRTVAWMGESQRGVKLVRLGLPATSARTPYDRLGDYVPWAAAGVAALAALAGAARRRGHLGGRGGAAGDHGAEYDQDSGLHVPG